jgi:hypothetical protein
MWMLRHRLDTQHRWPINSDRAASEPYGVKDGIDSASVEGAADISLLHS